MAPQEDAGWQKSHDDSFDDHPKVKEYSYRPSTTPILLPPAMVTPVVIEIEVSLDGTPSRPYTYNPPASIPPWWSSYAPSSDLISTTSSTSTRSKYYPASVMATVASTTSVIQMTGGDPQPTYSSGDGSATWRPWHGPPDNDDSHNGGIYAAAAVTPIVVLAIIALVVFLCLRKRKRQRMRVAGGTGAQEMKSSHNSQSATIQPYLASPLIPLPPPIVHRRDSYPRPANQTQPIILGPIPSSNNGAYLTGMDTSDVVSVTSASHFRPEQSDPFSDNNSLSEPPPPYRPRSVGPPSFISHSRHSSVRSNAPPASSRTLSMQRSPFDDPVEDDAISELSSEDERGGEAVSVVSDLSYQFDLSTTGTLRPR